MELQSPRYFVGDGKCIEWPANILMDTPVDALGIRELSSVLFRGGFPYLKGSILRKGEIYQFQFASPPYFSLHPLTWRVSGNKYIGMYIMPQEGMVCIVCEWR